MASSQLPSASPKRADKKHSVYVYLNPFRPIDWDSKTSRTTSQTSTNYTQPDGGRLDQDLGKAEGPAVEFERQSMTHSNEFKTAMVSDENTRRPQKQRDRRCMPWMPHQHLPALHLKRKGSQFTVRNQILRTLARAPVNALLVLVPVGFFVHAAHASSVTTFVVNFLAAVPLAIMVDYGMDEITWHTGNILGSLLYLSVWNLVQLISSILLLRENQITILKTTLTGSILADLLFILGISMAAGGAIQEGEKRNRIYQHFNPVVAHVSANILSLAATSLLIPTASKLLSQATPSSLEKQSRGASVVLIVVYVLYLYYQLKTHREVFDEKAAKAPLTKLKGKKNNIFMLGVDDPDVRPDLPGLPGHDPGGSFEHCSSTDVSGPECESHDNELHLYVAVVLFVASTVLLYFVMQNAVGSISSLIEAANVSETFVGLILFPIPNCEFSPIMYAIEDDMDMVMNYTVGKSLQTALLVTPLSVLLAWPMGIADVTLVFDSFQVVSLFSAVLMLNFLIIMGRGGWIQGVLLIAEWCLFAIAAFFA